jgi:hypothetical protein
MSSIEGATWHSDLAPVGEILWEIWMPHVSGGDGATCHAEMMPCVKRIWHT